jgi:hypothetical protein
MPLYRILNHDRQLQPAVFVSRMALMALVAGTFGRRG